MPRQKMTKRPYKKIHLLSKRLELRPYWFSDFKIVQKSHKNRVATVDKFDVPIPTSKESDYQKYKERLNRQRSHGKDELHFIFGVFDKKNGLYIGQIDLFTINKQLRWGNIGYHIQNQFYRRGYATEAGKLGLKAAFKFLGFHRVEAAMELDNKGSQQVAIKIGLKFEGKRIKFFPDKGGLDMNVYATNAIDYKF
jgi:ribosomal-protein-alanine N-acetyltransferase